MTKTVTIELTEILQEAREQALFLGELGVETVDLSVFRIVQEPGAELAISSQLPVRDAITPSAKKTPLQPLAPPDALFEGLAPATPVFPRATEALADIWRDIGDCTRCGLCEGRTQVVNTHGNHSARLMFIGEAPGADEDAQGKPFVGRAGQLLTKMIEAMGMKRAEVIIGTVNRCRPPGNRQPTLEEAAICRPFLFREIAVIQPKVIVVMGNTALRNLLEVREGITRVRGKFQDFRGIKVMPTFHPAYLLRDPSKKRETWEDLKMVRDYLESNPPKLKS